MDEKCNHQDKSGELAKWFNNLQFGEVFISCHICKEDITELVRIKNEKSREAYILKTIDKHK